MGESWFGHGIRVSGIVTHVTVKMKSSVCSTEGETLHTYRIAGGRFGYKISNWDVNAAE
jgi:hypothetical protein